MENQKTSEQTLKNEMIELQVERKPNCLVEFAVKATPSLVKDSQKQAIKSVAKETTVPGFRKGKAPDNLILKNFAKAVDERWQKSIAELAFKECEKLAKIPLLNNEARISFDMKSFDLKAGAELTFNFEAEPDVPKVKLSDFKIDKVKDEGVTQEKIEETIKRIRLFFSTWKQVSDRPVQNTDFIIVDIDLVDDENPQKAFSNTRLEVNEKGMAQWMYKIVLGMKTGEEKEGISEPDSDASEEDKNLFKPKKVKITLKTIEEPVLPAVDDDLAKKVGVDTADEMKTRLKSLLKKQSEEATQKEYREQISKQFLEKLTFELPESLMQREVQFRTSQNMSDASYKKYYDNLSADEKKEEALKLNTQAEEALRLFYICKQVSQDYKIDITSNDLDHNVTTTLDAMFADRDLLNPNKTDQQKALLMSRMLLSKSQDFIIEKLLEEKKTPKKETDS
ncbi:trigger factor [Candidatus Aerophobetes bacterium]|uniref:Trigger factor n=1 Tax=Aerophobetes bacterium TaxID=2030807 RepID=A0A2A4YFP0_UNCAE|nr:MAG: trigger factor [Candidatus Aerophobetes bacterium]